ncbi:transporter [Clostridium sp. 001]|uniref:putative ABC transporter permease subunit n=1 Tax=Clostridium sp. 001 TaxID=1970093 RepID=UPI001C2BAE64|nr:transporter [Clostridium sp. 001]QXE17653.1 transporter [Clostridium sp. 001]
MNNYIVLTKVLLKNGSNSAGMKKNSNIKKAALWIIILLALLPTIKLFSLFIFSAYDYLYKIGQQGLILSLGISFTSVFIFFFAIFYSINVLYFSKDIDLLLPLPLKPWEILLSKFTVILIYEYLTEVFILLPVLLIYGYKGSSNPLYFIYSALLFLIVPIIPIAAASILNMVIMSFTNIGKHRDILKILGGIFAMLFAIGLNIVLQKMTVSSQNYENIFKMINEGNNSLVSLSNRFFPGSTLSASSLVYSSSFRGFGNLILFIVLNILVILLFSILGEHLYFKGAQGCSEISAKRRELDYSKLNETSSTNSKFKALLLQEIKSLFRTPVYFMNCILANIIIPIVLFIPFLVRPDSFHELNVLVNIKVTSTTTMICIVISLAAGLIFGASNSITSTAISREGENIFVKKYLPISYSTQIMAKVISGVLVGITSIFLILIGLTLLVKLPICFSVISLLVSFIGILLTSMTGILIDLRFPKLHWDNEVKAVKQNFNTFINTIISFIFTGILIFSMINFYSYINEVAILGLCIIIAANFILYKAICSKGISMFKNIEI